MNQVILVGHLAQDIEVKKTASGKSYARFSVAVDDGADRPAQFIRCVAWEKTADNMAAYCKKGSSIVVSGRLVNSSYDDPKLKDVKRFSTDVVVNFVQFVGKKPDQVEENIPE